MLLVSCEGPAGRDGYDGRDGEGMEWEILNYTVYDTDWVLVGKPEEIGSYFMYKFNESMLTKFIFEKGNVSGYRWLDDNTQTTLSQAEYMSEKIKGEYYFFSDTYSFTFSPGAITFYVDYSDFATGTRPPTCDFRIVLNW